MIEYIVYDHNDLLCKYYLNLLFNQNLYHNNIDQKKINLKGIIETGSLLIFLQNEIPIGMIAIIVEEENGIKYAKFPYRAVFRNNSKTKYFLHAVHEIIDPYFFEWMFKRNILYYILTVNHYNYKALNVVVNQHDKKIKNIKNKNNPEWYNYYLLNANLHDKMIYEKYVWSYAFYVSPDKKFFLKRKEKNLEQKLTKQYEWII